MSSSTDSAKGQGPPDDPLYRSSLREALLILGIWGAAMLWVISYCSMYAYVRVRETDELPIVLGMPAWVVWGVFVPWIVADVLTIIICLWVIKDHDLEPSGSPPTREAADEVTAAAGH
jgi:hypothetical protein